MPRLLLLRLLSIFLIFFSFSCSRNIRSDLVDYSYTLYSEFNNPQNLGRVIPLTISKSAEIDGTIANEEKFLYFASNKNGNFDIYVRALGDIQEKAITQHAAEDRNPRVSPDGKKLIFFSRRDDFSGDIFLLEAKPEKWLTTAGPAIDEFSGKKKIGDLKNLTELRDERNVRRSVVDKEASWSPDGKWIVFVSNRGARALNNIWMMNASGKDLRQITFGGAEQPSFSADGKKIIFISYRSTKSADSSLGEIFEIKIANGRALDKAKQLSSNNDIEMYPIYLDTDNRIVYTSISVDTNNNGKLDLNDQSRLIYLDMEKKVSYPLTTSQNDSFQVRYYQNLFKRTNTIVYTALRDNNLDVSMIPVTGIIPRRANIVTQYNLAQQYLSEYNDEEKYILGLRRTWDFHAGNRLAYIFVPKAFVEIAQYYFERGKKKLALAYVDELQSIASSIPGKRKGQGDGKSIYSLIAGTFRQKFEGANALLAFEKLIRDFERENADELKAIEKKRGEKVESYPTDKMNQLAFLYELYGDQAAEQGLTQKTVELYDKALSIHSKYPLYLTLLQRSGAYKFHNINRYYQGNTLPEDWLTLLRSQRSLINIGRAENSMVERFLKEKNYRLGLRKIKIYRNKYKDIKNFDTISQYVESYFNLKLKRYARAEKGFKEVLKKVRKSQSIHFSSLYYLGQSAEAQGDKGKMAAMYHKAIDSYYRAFRNPAYHEIKQKLIDYYSFTGERLEQRRKLSQASAIYAKWVDLMNILNAHGLSKDLYESRGIEAHIRYIDTELKIANNDKTKITSFIEQYNAKKKIDLARVTFNKAYLYGAAYLYYRLAILYDSDYRDALREGTVVLAPRSEISSFLENFLKAEEELKWVTYMDEEYLDAYLLQGFIYTLVDVRRMEDGARFEDLYIEYFPEYLLEQTISIYSKSLHLNDENRNPEMEGDLYLNLANSYYLLKNYGKALENYQLVKQYKDSFGSTLQEALYYFHLGYTQWQNQDFAASQKSFLQVRDIYNTIQLQSSSRGNRLKSQIFRITQYLALLYREQKEYRQAIELYQQILSERDQLKKLEIPRERIYQELAYCYQQLNQPGQALDYLRRADELLKKQDKESRKSFSLRWKALNIKNEIGYKFDTGVLVPFLIPNLVVLNIADRSGIPWYNLGEDAAVIGDNRIYRPLNQTERFALNYSLYLRNYISSGDLNQAIEQLLQKWRILDDPENRFEWETKAVAGNNLAYYYYLTGRFDQSLEFFDKSYEIVTGEGYNDFDASIRNRINRTMVIFHILENTAMKSESKIALINASLKEIEEIIEDFEKNIYEQLIDEREEKLKAQKKKITDRDKKEVQTESDRRTRVAMFKLQLLKTNLSYYLLEIQETHILGQAQKNLDPEKLSQKKKLEYIKNRFDTHSKLYRSYRSLDLEYAELIDILRGRFNKGEKIKITVPAEIKNNRKLHTILYGNRARVQEKIGVFTPALLSYLQAIRIAREYNFNGLQAPLAYNIASLLRERPEIKDQVKKYYANHEESLFNFSLEEWDYYREAMGILENDLILGRNMRGLLIKLYEEAIAYQLDKNKNIRLAMQLAEKERELRRFVTIFNLRPQISGEGAEILESYYRRIDEIHEYSLELADIKEKIASRGSELSDIRKKLEDARADANRFRDIILRNYAHLAELVFQGKDGVKLPDLKPDEMLIYFKFQSNQLYTWYLLDGKLNFISKSFDESVFLRALQQGNTDTLANYLFKGLQSEAFSKKKWLISGNVFRYLIPRQTFLYSPSKSKSGASGKKNVFAYQPKADREILYRMHLQENRLTNLDYSVYRHKLIQIAGKKLQSAQLPYRYYKSASDIPETTDAGIYHFRSTDQLRLLYQLPVKTAALMIDLGGLNKQVEDEIFLWYSLYRSWRAPLILFYTKATKPTIEDFLAGIIKGDSFNKILVSKNPENSDTVNVKENSGLFAQYFSFGELLNADKDEALISRNLKAFNREYLFYLYEGDIAAMKKIHSDLNIEEAIKGTVNKSQSLLRGMEISLSSSDYRKFDELAAGINKLLSQSAKIEPAKNEGKDDFLLRGRLRALSLSAFYQRNGIEKGDIQLARFIDELKLLSANLSLEQDLFNSTIRDLKMIQAAFYVKQARIIPVRKLIDALTEETKVGFNSFQWELFLLRELGKSSLEKEYKQFFEHSRRQILTANSDVASKTINFYPQDELYFLNLLEAKNLARQNFPKNAQDLLATTQSTESKKLSRSIDAQIVLFMLPSQTSESAQKKISGLEKFILTNSRALRREIIMDLKLILAEIYLKNGKSQELISLLNNDEFADNADLKNWNYMQRIERLALLVEAYKDINTFHEFQITLERLLPELEKSYQYQRQAYYSVMYAEHLYQQKKFTKSLQYAEKVLQLNKITSLKDKDLLVNVSYLIYDISVLQKHEKRLKEINELLEKQYSRNWRTEYRRAMQLWQQKKYRQALMLFLRSEKQLQKKIRTIRTNAEYRDALSVFSYIAKYYREIEKNQEKTLQWSYRFSRWKFERNRELDQEKNTALSPIPAKAG